MKLPYLHSVTFGVSSATLVTGLLSQMKEFLETPVPPEFLGAAEDESESI